MNWPDELELTLIGRAVWTIAEQWDGIAETARADVEMRHGDEPGAHSRLAETNASLIESRRAFANSRAATSVFRCLEQDPLHAAILAYYEAFHATRDGETASSNLLRPSCRRDRAQNSHVSRVAGRSDESLPYPNSELHQYRQVRRSFAVCR